MGASVVISGTDLHSTASISGGGGLGRPGRRDHRRLSLGITIKASDDPLDRAVATHTLLIEQHLAGRFKALLIAFA